MGRGGAIYLSYAALVLLSAITPASAGLWDVDIDLDPAPSPEDGPPFSANATRDRALLPYQIIGVVAAYLGTVFIAGTLLLTVGRRLRRQAQSMEEKPTEMRPVAGVFGLSPISPIKKWGGSVRSKKSTTSSLRSPGSVGSPGGYSTRGNPFDQDVLSNDRKNDSDKLAALYEAVWDEDRKDTVPTLSVPVPDRPDRPRVQAIYPESHATNDQIPSSPRSPVMNRSEQRLRATSFGSNSIHNFAAGPSPDKRTLRKSIRHLKISSPIQRLRDDDNDDGARTPLSPRFYVDPGMPPEPPTSRTLDSQGYPVTPGSTVTADFVGAYGGEVEALDAVRGPPQPYPQRSNLVPQKQQLESPERKRNATNTTAALPLRRYNQDVSQRRQLQFNTQPLSPGPMSGTVRTDLILPRNPLASLRTGGKETPYSPYFVGSILTPVTPTIMSRDQRKQQQKKERAERGPIMEEDMVADEQDLWNGGY